MGKVTTFQIVSGPLDKTKAHTIGLIYIDIGLKLFDQEHEAEKVGNSDVGGGFQHKEFMHGLLKRAKAVVTTRVSSSEDAQRFAHYDMVKLETSLSHILKLARLVKTFIKKQEAPGQSR